jgi:hypothetical protein
MKIVGAALCLMMAATGFGEAKAAWHVATSDHFIIYSEESADSLRAYAQKLERFDALLRRNQSAMSRPVLPSDRLTIFALSSQQALHRVLGANSGEIAGIYKPSVTGSIALTSRNKGSDPYELNTQIVLLHEYSHHFMLLNFPTTYPTWFVEGYAEFYSVSRFEDNGDISIGMVALDRARELMMSRDMPTEKIFAGKIEYDAILEAKGWLLTHYLTFEPSRRGQLSTFLTALDAGKPPLDAAKQAFGDLRALDRELKGYILRKQLSYMKISASAFKPGPVVVGEVSPGEAAMMEVKMNSRLGVDQREAQERVTQARRIAPSYPNDPAVQCALAEAEDDAGHPPETDAAADRLLAVDPKSLCGMIFKGRAAMARATEAKAPAADPAWSEARQWLSRANRAEPENPWPMALYYSSYRRAHDTPSANAMKALYAAQERAPQDPSLRLEATTQLLRDGKPDDARAMMTPMLGHGGDARLRALYARIGQDDAKSLADEIENGPPKPAKK